MLVESRGHPYLPTLGRVLRRISHDVADALHEASLVSSNKQGSRARYLYQLVLLLSEERGDGLDALRNGLCNVDGLSLESDQSLVDACDVEQIVDESRQLPHLPSDHVDRRRVGRQIPRRTCEKL